MFDLVSNIFLINKTAHSFTFQHKHTTCVIKIINTTNQVAYSMCTSLPFPIQLLGPIEREKKLGTVKQTENALLLNLFGAPTHHYRHTHITSLYWIRHKQITIWSRTHRRRPIPKPHAAFSSLRCAHTWHITFACCALN